MTALRSKALIDYVGYTCRDESVRNQRMTPLGYLTVVKKKYNLSDLLQAFQQKRKHCLKYVKVVIITLAQATKIQVFTAFF